MKTYILQYDFEPFAPEPFSDWDPSRMESFEPLPRPVRPDRKVISSLSLGLICTATLGGTRTSHVERKAKEESFYDSALSNVMLDLNQPSGKCTQQPCRHRSIAIHSQ